jgi:hypothetical protein
MAIRTANARLQSVSQRALIQLEAQPTPNFTMHIGIAYSGGSENGKATNIGSHQDRA